MGESAQARGQNRSTRGEHVYHGVTIAAEEAASGLVIEVDYEAAEPCSTCGGYGRPYSQQSEKCPRCAQKLNVRRADTFVLPDQCWNCGWSGFQTKCDTCSGSGTQTKGKSLVVKIPPGVKDGTRLRINGKGSKRTNEAEGGDLFVCVSVASGRPAYRNYTVIESDGPQLFSRTRVSNASHHADNLDEPFPRLLDLAEPMLFRKNPFRLLGLSVYANEREIKRYVEKLQIMSRIGDGSIEISGPLAIQPPPDDNSIRNAIHELRDPEKRLIYEVLWFWPTSDRDDPALVELMDHRIKGAIDIWQSVLSEELRLIALHNLAVLYHTAALDLEYAAQSQPTSAETRKLQDTYWQQGFLCWKNLIGDSEFWGLVNRRIRELDEPQLTTGTVRQFQLTLPTALLSLNAQLAVAAAERGARDEMRRQRRLMNESGFESGAAERSTSRALSPIKHRITRLCEVAESEVNGREVDGARITRKLLEEAKPLLILLDELLPSGNHLRDDARDLVAQTAMNCQIPFGNKTEDWNECVELLELTKSIPVSLSLKNRIQESLRVVKENLKLKELITCWFCKKRVCDDDALLEVPMYGDVRRYSTGYNKTRVEWRTATVNVPRCKECLATHKRSKRLLALGFILGLAVGIILCLVAWLISGVNDQSADLPIVAASGFILIAMSFLGLDVGDQLAKCSTPEGTIHRSHSLTGLSLIPARGYPGIEEMKAKGWTVGGRPST